jgi:hypothetical protein
MQDGKKSGSGMNIPDHIPKSLEKIFRLTILQFFEAVPDPGSCINIPDRQHWEQQYHMKKGSEDC